MADTATPTPPAAPAAPAAPEATPVELEQNEFGSEFAKIVEGLKEPGTAPATPAAPAAVAPAVTPPATPAVETPPVTPPATPAAEATPPVTPPATPTVEELQAQLAASQAALEEAKKAPPAAAPATPAAATPAAPAAPAAPVVAPLYTEEEQAALAQYNKEWEVVARGEELKRRAEYRQLVQYIFDQVNARYSPVLEHVDSLTDRTHKSDLFALVPDYAQVRDQAVTWAQAQTGIHRSTYDRVIAEGSPEEVRDLIEEWRAKTGYKAQPVAPAATAAPAVATPTGMPPAAANDPAKTAALAALRPVDSQRSARTEGADPNDFDSAFVEFSTAAAR